MAPCPHCDSEDLTLGEVFELCCIAFDQCQAALAAHDHAAFIEAQQVHAGYADLHRHLASGGLIH